MQGSSLLLQHANNDESSTNNDTHKEQGDQAVAHDVPCGEPCDSQSRQCPEWLDHIGPGIAPCDRHSSYSRGYAQMKSGRHHDWALHCPLAAARGNEEVDDSGRQEGEYREGHLIGDRNEEVTDLRRQGCTTFRCEHHHPHDPCVEGELQDDPCGSTSCLLHRPHVTDRGLVENDPQDQEDEVDDVQGQVESCCDEIVDQIDQARQRDDRGMDPENPACQITKPE